MFTFLGKQSTLTIAPPEICNNALDDDGDGKIDLNDEDCFCPLLKPTSLIPNPSFEDQDCCPEQHSSAHCATGWIQASEATPDYYHLCDWTANGALDIPQPLPDGEGFIGFIDGVINGDNNPDWKEYVGTCLPQPLQKDSLYRLQFYLGFLDRATSPDTDFVLFGTRDCDNLPFGEGDNTFGCPSNSRDWVRLGSVSAFGKNEWKQFNFTFKPPYEVYAIVAGPDCYHRTLTKNTYYFLDNLELAPDNNFDIAIKVNDQPCSANLAFEIPHLAGYEYQWYKDGIAIIGATESILKQPKGAGKYEVKVENEAGCKVSEPYIHNLPYLVTRTRETICRGDTYTFGNQQINAPGIYWDTVKTKNNCDSIIRMELSLKEDFEKAISAKILPNETYRIGSIRFNQPGEYTRTIPTENGCDSTIYLKLDYYSVYIPTIFSPNKDGINEVFTIFGGDELRAVSELQVFDRWGNLQYKGLNLETADGWDGQFNGKNAPAGVYLYQAKIELDDAKERTVSGSFTLLR